METFLVWSQSGDCVTFYGLFSYYSDAVSCRKKNSKIVNEFDKETIWAPRIESITLQEKSDGTG